MTFKFAGCSRTEGGGGGCGAKGGGVRSFFLDPFPTALVTAKQAVPRILRNRRPCLDMSVVAAVEVGGGHQKCAGDPQTLLQMAHFDCDSPESGSASTAGFCLRDRTLAVGAALTAEQGCPSCLPPTKKKSRPAVHLDLNGTRLGTSCSRLPANWRRLPINRRRFR